MSRIEEVLLMLFIMIPGAFICALIDVWRERRAYKKWLREGRWKYEEFHY